MARAGRIFSSNVLDISAESQIEGAERRVRQFGNVP